MIQAFVEKNRKLLGFCSRNVRSVGWVLIVFATYGLLAVMMQVPHLSIGAKAGIGPTIIKGISAILQGIMILGLGGIFKYLLNPEQRVSWILRHGDLILYAYAAAIACAAIWGIVSVWSHTGSELGFYQKLIIYSSGLLFASLKIFVLVSIGPLVRRIVPLLEESMTLV